ncbi:hypothetical protein PSCICM_51130 [Pseudomonas cichorii]|uniref:DUF6124 family protein n=1 Tax=Pseudomonas cichorii TaxID=36746 RepID=UPI0019E35722|nr:DUF3077 domain-containing protein [Pseudomonas cichorii]GFM79294.1 hypothetical protein PSCICM_51130 [Pseudomonas cichorii]
MFKVSPNPPVSFIHCSTPQGIERDDRQPDDSSHDALLHASSLLDCAAATAYENADNLTGSHRKVAMGVVHLIEMAKAEVDRSLDDISVR